jgi:hypothetical protein
MKLWLRRIFAADLRSLALFRIALGLLIVLDVLLRIQDFAFFFTEQGPLPLKAIVEDTNTGKVAFSLYFLTSYRIWPYLLMAATGLGGVALAVGWRTRRVCPVLWLLCLSMQSRAPLSLNSSDRLVLSFLFFASFLPLDRLWAIGKPRRLPDEEYRIYHPAAAAIILQMIVMYAMSASFKWSPVWTGDGSALYRTLLSAHFSRGTPLVQYPQVCRMATYAVVVWESIGPLLLLLPWTGPRTAALMVFAAFHVGTGILLDIGLFPLVCLLGLMAWLPSGAWRRRPEDLPVQALPCGTLARVAIAAALILITVGNVAQTRFSGYGDSALRKLCSLTGFEQNWMLFAPSPPLYDVWYVAVAEYADGSRKDLLSPQTPPERFFLKPAGMIGAEMSHRRRQYFLGLEHVSGPGLFTWLAYDLFRKETREVPAGHLVRVTLYQCRSENRLDFRDAPPTYSVVSAWPEKGMDSH